MFGGIEIHLLLLFNPKNWTTKLNFTVYKASKKIKLHSIYWAHFNPPLTHST